MVPRLQRIWSMLSRRFAVKRDREHTYWKGWIFLRLFSLLGYLLRLVRTLYKSSVKMNQGKHDGLTFDSLASLFAIDLSSSSEYKPKVPTV